MGLIEKKRKALFIKGFFHDIEKLIKIAKSEAAKTGMKGRIVVLDIGHYNPALNGRTVVVEEAGGEYSAQGGGAEPRKINEN